MRSAYVLWLIVLVLALSARLSFARDNILIADFEGTSYGDWTVEGDAFGAGPTVLVQDFRVGNERPKK